MNPSGLTDPTTQQPESLRIDRLIPRFGGTSGANLRHAAGMPGTDPGRLTPRAPLRWAAVVSNLGRAWR